MKTGPAAFALGVIGWVTLVGFAIFVSWPLAEHWVDIVVRFWWTAP